MADAVRPMEPMIFDGHVEIAIEALSEAAFQCDAAARFLKRDANAAAVDAYRRAVRLHREFAAPSMRVIADAVSRTGETS